MTAPLVAENATQLPFMATASLMKIPVTAQTDRNNSVPPLSRLFQQLPKRRAVGSLLI